MFPQALIDFFAAKQEVLWLTTLMLDLGGTVVLYRLFGKAGLQVAIATAIILANLQGPKLTIIFGLETSLGVIFYSSIFFATDVLSENYGKHEAARAGHDEPGAHVPAEHEPQDGRFFAGHTGRVFNHPRFLAALRVRFVTRLPDQPAFRRLGVPQDQGVDGRTLAVAAE
jgi:hypothetical protein